MLVNWKACQRILLFVLVFSCSQGILLANLENHSTPRTEVVATFAGGCFWCMQPPYDQTVGVKRTIVGFTGGVETKPTYEEVASGQTGHTEAIRIIFDPAMISYEELLNIFWKNIDPTAHHRQFADVGSQYRAEIFYHTDEQRKLAEESKKSLIESNRFDEEIVTQITKATDFYPAEEYHQKYYQKKPFRYKFYRYGSGRDQFLKEIWGEK